MFFSHSFVKGTTSWPKVFSEKTFISPFLLKGISCAGSHCFTLSHLVFHFFTTVDLCIFFQSWKKTTIRLHLGEITSTTSILPIVSLYVRLMKWWWALFLFRNPILVAGCVLGVVVSFNRWTMTKSTTTWKSKPRNDRRSIIVGRNHRLMISFPRATLRVASRDLFFPGRLGRRTHIVIHHHKLVG